MFSTICRQGSEPVCPDDPRNRVLIPVALGLLKTGIARSTNDVPVEEVHHIKPLSEGGTHDAENLISLCKYHHSKIHAQRGDRWHRRRKGNVEKKD